MDAEYEYLSPDFDPGSITVPRLRSILVAHNVKYPSSAKKPELIALFNEHVAPQAKKMLSAQSRTKRSTRGIIDVPSREASVASEDTEDSDVPSVAPSESVRRSTRRSTRALTEESDAPSLAPSASTRRSSRRTATASVEPDVDLTPVPRSRTSRSPSKRSSVRPSRAMPVQELEEIDERPPPSRQSMLSVQSRLSSTPVVKKEDPGKASPFSTDNPFQSGSSPAYEPRTVERERRRKTIEPEFSEKRKSTSSRRKTQHIEHDHEDGAVVPVAKTYEAPVSRRKRDPTPVVEETDELEAEISAEDEEVDNGEEFTPEEQLELVRERAAQGKTDILPPRRNTPRQGSSSFKVGAWSMFVVLVIVFGSWWRNEKLEVGYCGIGRPSTNVLTAQIPPEYAEKYAHILERLQPQCEPCPHHAMCYPHLRTECDSDFIERPHPLSFGGLVPLPPTCEPDGEKARKVKAVADRAVEELRERNAKFECGDLVDEAGKHLPSPEINEQELKEEIATKRRKGMSQSEFNDLWSSAIGEVMDRDEIVSGVDGDSGSRVLASTSLARISLACAARRSLRLALARHLWKLVSLLAIFGAYLYAKFLVTSSRATEERAKLLASFALDQLKAQAAWHAVDPHTYPEGFISMGQLRDDILRDEFSAKRRQKLWERVQKKVEQNSNVRPSVRESRSGDVSRVWEWTGAVRAINDGSGSAFKRSISTGGEGDRSRLSLGGYGGASPAEQPKIKHEMQEKKTWEEGRPVY